MNLGQTIKKLRQQKGFKQNTFAALCSLSPAYLSQIEGNLKEPNLSILRNISSNLNIPLPIMFFMALDEQDIPERKQDVFKLIKPLVYSLINDFINSDEDN